MPSGWYPSERLSEVYKPTPTRFSALNSGSVESEPFAWIDEKGERLTANVPEDHGLTRPSQKLGIPRGNVLRTSEANFGMGSPPRGKCSDPNEFIGIHDGVRKSRAGQGEFGFPISHLNAGTFVAGNGLSYCVIPKVRSSSLRKSAA